MKQYWNCQDVSQKFPNGSLDTNWEFLSFGAGVWGPTLKVPNGIWGKASQNLTFIRL